MAAFPETKHSSRLVAQPVRRLPKSAPNLAILAEENILRYHQTNTRINFSHFVGEVEARAPLTGHKKDTMESNPAKTSGIAISVARVSNFRSLEDIEVHLGSLTVLLGANNAGKTSFLDALHAAIGAGRRQLAPADIRLAKQEAFAPKDRKIVIDLKIIPVADDGSAADSFPEGSFWTALWGASIFQDFPDFHDFMAFRTTLSWNEAKADYIVERKFLTEWRGHADWLDTPTQDKTVSTSQTEPIMLHYIDAKRDLDEDLRRQGSFWRRMTEDLGLSADKVEKLEQALSEINQEIVDGSAILGHLKKNLSGMQTVVAGESDGVDISPVARRLRDLSKGVDVTFSTQGAQAFPLARHGMGTRSLGALLVFRAFADWRNSQAEGAGDKVHSVLALEEPESHLHPQAQRALFGHVREISGQRIVSTHSPYFAGQARLEDLRLFIKSGGDTTVTQLDLAQLERPDDKRKLEDTVIESRGDLLFSRAVILFEGQTEEQALPIWAKKYWGASIHELGFSFVRVNGTNYFPFIWLAKSLQIPWFVFADGENDPLQKLQDALRKAGQPKTEECPHVVVMPNGNNFETQLFADGYFPEIETALNQALDKETFLDGFIEDNDGKPYGKGKGNRNYKIEGGREIAAQDALKNLKTKMARPLATTVSEMPDKTRRFPPQVAKLFEAIGKQFNLSKAEGESV